MSYTTKKRVVDVAPEEAINNLTSMMNDLTSRISALEIEKSSSKKKKKNQTPPDHPDKVVMKAKSMFYHMMKNDQTFIQKVNHVFTMAPNKKSLIMNWKYVKNHSDGVFEALNTIEKDNWFKKALTEIVGVAAASNSSM